MSTYTGDPERKCPVCGDMITTVNDIYLKHLQLHWFEIELQKEGK